jgi:hypothetical protein
VVYSESTVSTLLTCLNCCDEFTPANRRQRFCSGRCRAAAAYLVTKRTNEAKRLAALPQKNADFVGFNRDRSLGFDGRYGGPTPSWHRPKPRRLKDRITRMYEPIGKPQQAEEKAMPRSVQP